MLVSVVTPAYNQASLLRIALESALAQTYRQIEIVVVDDGSTDDTQQVCESLNDGRIRYIKQANDGSFGQGARNRAMLEARGEWIALLDQDDVWVPEKIEHQLKLVSESADIGCVFCWARFIDVNGVETGRQPEIKLGDDPYAELLSRNRYYASTGMFRRSLLALAGLPHESSGYGDWWLWLSLARHTRLGMVEAYLADYRIQEQSYQQLQLKRDLGKLATDNWRTLASHEHRIPSGQTARRRAWRLGMQSNQFLFFSAAIHYFQSGQFAIGFTQYAKAIEIAPMHGLMPAKTWRIILSLLRGLYKKAFHD